jgi:hypothetical protein
VGCTTLQPDGSVAADAFGDTVDDDLDRQKGDSGSFSKLIYDSSSFALAMGADVSTQAQFKAGVVKGGGSESVAATFAGGLSESSVTVVLKAFAHSGQQIVKTKPTLNKHVSCHILPSPPLSFSIYRLCTEQPLTMRSVFLCSAGTTSAQGWRRSRVC